MRYVPLLTLVIVVGLAGCLSGGQESTEVSTEGENVVVHNTSGFFPRTITIEQGETVTWRSTGSNMWVGSDAHPTHTEYAGTSLSEHCSDSSMAGERFDTCEGTDEYSFTFESTGEWGYHNHLLASQRGTVIVE